LDCAALKAEMNPETFFYLPQLHLSTKAPTLSPSSLVSPQENGLDRSPHGRSLRPGR
jgi:hypothetical protein